MESNGHKPTPFVAVTFLTAGTMAPQLVLQGLNPLQVREALDRLGVGSLKVAKLAASDPKFGDASYLLLSAFDSDNQVATAASFQLSPYQYAAALHLLRIFADAAILGFIQSSLQQKAASKSDLLIPTH